MPYRLKGKCVQVKRTVGWVNLKCHDTQEEAQAHLSALNLNVRESKGTQSGSMSKSSKVKKRGNDY